MKKHLLILVAITISLIRTQAQTTTLWGFTSSDGAYGNGTLFEVDTSGAPLTTAHNFGGVPDGAQPIGTLFQASDTLLYGTTDRGGDTSEIAEGEGAGVLFSYYAAKGSYTVLHHFGVDSDGFLPDGALIQAYDGLLYGTTQLGGAIHFSQGAQGTIYSYNISTGIEKVLHTFGFGFDGMVPPGSLLQGKDSLLYGMAPEGGYNQWGMIYSYNISSGVETDLYDFMNAPDGAAPQGALIQLNDSLLYGLTTYGGNSFGTIFKYNIPLGKETTLHSFGIGSDGKILFGSLIKASNGLLYGMTYEGGANNKGTIFSYDAAKDTEMVVHNFGAGADGQNPNGSLLQVSNGLLYGMTYGGGTNDSGMIFSYNISTGVESDIHDFTGADGANPVADLIELVNIKTSVNQLTVDNGQLTVYPNPSSDFIHLSLTLQQVQPVLLSLYNILGQQVWSVDMGNVKKVEATIPVTDLADGVYALKVNEGSMAQQREIVVTR